MAKFEIKELNYITQGTKQNSFNIGYCYTDDGNISKKTEKPKEMAKLNTSTFFGNIGEYNSMSQKYNSDKESFYDIDNGVIIHNLYPLQKIKIQSTTLKNESSTSMDRVDIIVPTISTDFIKMCQFDTYSYALTNPTSDNPTTKTTIYNNYISPNDYSYKYRLSSRGYINTYLYTPPQHVIEGQDNKTYEELINNNPTLSSEILSTIFYPYKDLKGIEYNYFVEIPECNKYNQYEKQSIAGDMFMAKNHLNYLYSMDYDDSEPTYYKLEYIESSGKGEYINFELNPANTFKTYIKFEPLENLNSKDPFRTSTFFYGITNNTSGYRYRLFNGGYDSLLYFDIKDKRLSGDQFDEYILRLNANTTYEFELGNYYVRDIGNDGVYYSNNEEKVSYFYSDQALQWLTGREKARLYYIKICDGDDILMDMFPVKRISDGKVCLYDSVSGKFILPKTGTFIAGPQKPNFSLKNCRDYCNIDVCGDELYATYRTNISYYKEQANVTYLGGSQNVSNNQTTIVSEMKKYRTDYSYQHVEIIRSVQKYDQSNGDGHKSSMFSLKIIDSGLNQSTIPEKVKQKLRQNITNGVKTAISKIIPANTQLFNIYFEGK